MPNFYRRSAHDLLHSSLRQYPVVVVTGPRQAGKSTFLRQTLPNWQMVSLEDLDMREFAQQDARGFLRRFPTPLIIDEAQRVPELLSYIQTVVDASGKMGQYVLSGSQQFSLMAGVTQSLAGRASFIQMLPLRLKEMQAAEIAIKSLDELMVNGGFPAVYSRQIAASKYYADYVASYVERDVRSLSAVQDLGNFQRFMRLCAARTGQLLNLNSLANDCGIAQPTANAWLNLLEASFLVKRVAPYYRNFGKRLVKAPKLYFLDTGLCAWLLGIQSARDLQNHYARGALFETWVVTEALKWKAAHGDSQALYFWRDNIGNEVDLLLEQGGGFTLVEIKSGATFQNDWSKSLDTVTRHIKEDTRKALIYGGEVSAERTSYHQIAWRDLGQAN
jgi:uncharacterized protein